MGRGGKRKGAGRPSIGGRRFAAILDTASQEMLEHVRQRTGCPSSSEAIRVAIGIAYALTSDKQKGCQNG